MYAFQIILVFCVVALAYCHHGNAQPTSTAQLLDGLFKETLLPKEVQKLLRNYDHPVTKILAHLMDFDESYCRFVPLDGMQVVFNNIRKFGASKSIENYLKYCEEQRIKKCNNLGIKPLVNSWGKKGRTAWQSTFFETKSSPDEVFSLLEPFSLDSKIFPWVFLGNGDDLSKCRYTRDKIYYEEVRRLLEAMEDFVKDRYGKLVKHCTEHASTDKDEFLTRLRRLEGEKDYESNKENLMKLVEYTPSRYKDHAFRRKFMPRELATIKRNYASKFLHDNSPISDLVSKIWDSLLSTCESYTSLIGADNVQKFIPGHFKDSLESDKLKWLLALTICHDLLHEKNKRKKEPPQRIYIRTAASSIRKEYKLGIAVESGFYEDLIYN